MTKYNNLGLWLSGEVRSRVSKFCYVHIVVAGRNGEGNYYSLKTQNVQHTEIFHI